MCLSVCPISLLSTILGCQGKFVLVLNLHPLVTVFGANLLQFILFTELPPLLRPTCHSQSWHLSRMCQWKVRKVRFWGNRGAADIRKINPTKFQATEFGDTWYVEYWIQRYCFRSTFWHNQKLQIWNIFCLKYEYFVEIFAAFASNHLYLLRKSG